jgi:hypothetical protein
LLEVSNILSEEANTLDEMHLEFSLFDLKLISDGRCLANKLSPVFIKDLLRINLFLIHDVRNILLKNSVHVNYRSLRDQS